MRSEIKIAFVVGVLVVAGAIMWSALDAPREKQLASLPPDFPRAAPSSTPSGASSGAAREPLLAARPRSSRAGSPIDGRSDAPHLPVFRPEDRGSQAPPAIVPPSPADIAAANASRASVAPSGAATGMPDDGHGPATPMKPANAGVESRSRTGESPATARQDVSLPIRRADEPAPSVLAPPPTSTVPSGVKYVIQPGDKLITICREHYDDEKLWSKVAEANPGLNPNRLVVGTTIMLPPKAELAGTAPAPGDGRADAPLPPAAKPSAAGQLAEATEHRDGAIAGQEAQGAAPAVRSALPGTHVVAKGDTLIRIARTVLEDERRWREIYELNQDQLSSANAVLKVGMTLKLPPKRPAPGTETR